MKTIGARVRDLRKAKGFARQGDLGKLVGVDQSVISDIERGAGFKADVLMALCEHLDTTAEYLMLGDEQASQGEAEILSLYRKTSDEGRNAMIVMARGLRASYPRVGRNPSFTGGLRESPATETPSQLDTSANQNYQTRRWVIKEKDNPSGKRVSASPAQPERKRSKGSQ